MRQFISLTKKLYTFIAEQLWKLIRRKDIWKIEVIDLQLKAINILFEDDNLILWNNIILYRGLSK